MYTDVLNELISIKDEEKKDILQRFFKTGKGEYGEGDLFLGIKVPEMRSIAKKYYKEISLEDTLKLLHNEYHEVRLTALIILVYKYEKGDKDLKGQIYDTYLDNTKYINNWDLVDLSSPNIVGNYIYENNIDRKILYNLINSNNLWKQRIAILATFYFIKNNDFKDTLNICELLIDHKHDLIHKASGWMLREIGNRDYNVLYNFLILHYKKMPRTMLRYAIEKMSKKDKEYFMMK